MLFVISKPKDMYFIPTLLLLIIVLTLWSLFRLRYTVLSHWSHPFDRLRFSSQTFYDTVTKSIQIRNVPDVNFSMVAHVEKIQTIVFDPRREYLSVRRNEYEFKICAAPFGTGFFVSWWFLQRERGYMTFIKKIPVIRWLVSTKTFYQLDTEEMYRSFVHLSVLEAIDEMTTAKGKRALTEMERSIKPLNL